MIIGHSMLVHRLALAMLRATEHTIHIIADEPVQMGKTIFDCVLVENPPQFNTQVMQLAVREAIALPEIDYSRPEDFRVAPFSTAPRRLHAHPARRIDQWDFG
jgi:hypothetical protein